MAFDEVLKHAMKENKGEHELRKTAFDLVNLKAKSTGLMPKKGAVGEFYKVPKTFRMTRGRESSKIEELYKTPRR